MVFSICYSCDLTCMENNIGLVTVISGLGLGSAQGQVSEQRSQRVFLGFLRSQIIEELLETRRKQLFLLFILAYKILF